MRTRPPKKNPKILSKLTDYIKQGRTIRDACRFCGISTTTFNRWRNSDLSFNKDVILATKDQWKYASPKSPHRTYSRNTYISPVYDENAFKSPQNAPETHSNDKDYPTTIQGIPVRYGSIYDDRPYIPCVDKEGIFVTFIEKHGSIGYHKCYTLSEWLGKNQHYP